MERELGDGDAGVVQAVDGGAQRLVARDGDGDHAAGGEDREGGRPSWRSGRGGLLEAAGVRRADGQRLAADDRA